MNETVGKREAGDVDGALLRAIDRSSRRLTPNRLEALVSRETGTPLREIRNAVRSLVRQGTLQYTYTFGCSFLERSFRRPVEVSPRISLVPPDIGIPTTTDRFFIRIIPGAAFGGGEHPSTRLALRGIDHVFASGAVNAQVRALDIGTGSGVLALAAVKLGAAGALALDIDPCALSEAAGNVRLNRLEKKIEISGEPLGSVRGRYGLVTANLRLPTLLRIEAELPVLCPDRAALVFSGFRVEEWPDLTRRYRQAGFTPLWKADEKGWCCAAFGGRNRPATIS